MDWGRGLAFILFGLCVDEFDQNVDRIVREIASYLEFAYQVAAAIDRG